MCRLISLTGGLCFGRKRPAKRGRGTLQHVEGAIGSCFQLIVIAHAESCLEHHRVARRLLAGEGEIGTAEILEGRERRRYAVVPRHVELGGEALEAVAGKLGEQRLAIAEMPVWRGGANAGEPRRLGQAEAGRPVLLDQLARRLEQDLLKIAVVIGARPVPALIVGAHVRGFYMKGANAAIRAAAMPPLPCGQRVG